MDNDIFNRGITNLIYEVLNHPGCSFIYSCYWDTPRPLTSEIKRNLTQKNSFRTDSPVKYIKNFFSTYKELNFISLKYDPITVLDKEPFRITFYYTIN